ncbi:UvrD-helicase domain-containing protein [Vibrio splendidus]|uniref:UvrD-helicase domain-containing protein n=1 Tax=Vibrio splendidus TaxID=29497 RepID=UPI000C8586BB|nr:UvrD-helicase domain-containing protein [Vibrio splendidus]PMI52433.1 hypothetical protein BCU42_23725 [Vibrio splendidus]
MVVISDEDIIEVEKELGVNFDDLRREIIKNFDDVQACPGSGKTTMVAAKLLIIAKSWTPKQKGVCVLTHTNVAKEEIISRLEKNSYGVRLLTYPHFIGTIQEFVNRFLAVPYLRSSGCSIEQIDDDVCMGKAWSFLSWKAKAYIERRSISLQDLQYQWKDSKLVLNIPGFPNGSKSDSYRSLDNAKSRLIEEGCFYFNEMYAFARDYLKCNAGIKSAIQSRFPVVFIDEMQDTQKFQDELLNEIFLCELVSYQRFGDPDQAIYSGEGKGNQTYNDVALDKIENSHRFDSSIAQLAKKLSFNRINLISSSTDQRDTPHTIFLVDEHSRNNVFDKFAELCAAVVPEGTKNLIKTVGAVGTKKEDGLTICNYLESYEKCNSTSKFKPTRFIQYFYKAKKQESSNQSYQLILDGCIQCGRLAEAKITYLDGTTVAYSRTSLRRYLKESGRMTAFNIKIKEILVTTLDEIKWNELVSECLRFINLQGLAGIADFICFDNDATRQDLENAVYGSNVVTTLVEDRYIVNEVTTIHAVKGETHAATLVLETKFHEFDAESLVDYILGSTVKKPKGVRKIKFMKQFYVAFSRPTNLLCLAMDKSRFPEEHIGKGEYGGWKIVDLTQS